MGEASWARARRGDVDGAIAELRARLDAAPDDAEAWLTLGMILLDAGRAAEACAPLERAAALEPHVALAELLLARALDRLGRGADAIVRLEAARARAADDAGAAAIDRELGSLRYARGDLDGAERDLARAASLPLAPRDRARVAFALGMIHDARRDLARAIAAYREAVHHDPTHLDAWLTLGDALAAAGEHAQAIDALAAALRLDPTNERAAHNRDVLLRALEHVRAHRLLASDARAIAASALVEAAAMRPEPTAPGALRFASPLASLDAAVDAAGRVTSLFFALRDPAAAARAPGDAFGVTVVGRAGAQAASFAAAASITFLREALGVPMTQASALFARLLASPEPIHENGATACFATRGDRHGLLVTRAA